MPGAAVQAEEIGQQRCVRVKLSSSQFSTKKRRCCNLKTKVVIVNWREQRDQEVNQDDGESSRSV